MRYLQIALLSLLFLSLAGSRVLAVSKTCPPRVFSSGQSVMIENEVVARYGSQHGSPGRFSYYEDESVDLVGEAICEDGSWWWSVSNGRFDGFVPEDGAFALTEHDPFRKQSSAAKSPNEQKRSSGSSPSPRSCARLATPNLPAGTRVIQILAQCLNLRSSPELKSGNVVGTARNGSRFRLAFDPSPSWFLISVPGLGDVWAYRGAGDSLSKQIE